MVWGGGIGDRRFCLQVGSRDRTFRRQNGNSRRFCERNAEETIHAPVRCANERRGVHLDLGMPNGSCARWAGPTKPEPKFGRTKTAHPGYSKDRQEDQ